MSDPTLNIAASGLRTSEAQYEALVNNLVNAHTVGYKSVGAAVKSFPEFLSEIENQQSGANILFSTKDPSTSTLDNLYADFSPGNQLLTNRNLDFAIEGEGFFTVQTPSGIAYTRDGRFTLNSEGMLITTVGAYPVLGEKGPILIPAGTKFEVLPNGQIMVDDNLIDQIKISAFENPKFLEVAGGSFFRTPVDREIALKREPQFQLKQGVVETSNVSVVDEMTRMIVLMRMHEGNVNVAKARDTLLSKVVDMGTALKP